MITGVSVLYTERGGPYPHFVSDCWDVARDARGYSGPNPVVAHPPCGPWGRMRYLCTKQDPLGGVHALKMVRRFGGVLEHPALSMLFLSHGMPAPGEPCDEYGGMTYSLRQVDFGHPCVKPTWIYCVGIDPRIVRRELAQREGKGVATRRITSGKRGPQLPTCTRDERIFTPFDFATWLVSIAACASVTHHGVTFSSP